MPLHGKIKLHSKDHHNTLSTNSRQVKARMPDFTGEYPGALAPLNVLRIRIVGGRILKIAGLHEINRKQIVKYFITESRSPD